MTQSVANPEKGEVEVAVMWDFNALNYRDQIDAKRFYRGDPV